MCAYPGTHHRQVSLDGGERRDRRDEGMIDHTNGEPVESEQKHIGDRRLLGRSALGVNGNDHMDNLERRPRAMCAMLTVF